MKIHKSLSVLLVLLYSLGINSLWAKELSQLEMGGLYQENSEKTFQRTSYFMLRNNRRYLAWPYEGAQNSAYDFGVRAQFMDGESEDTDYVGTKVRPFVGRKFSQDLYLEAQIGVNRFYDIKIGKNLRHHTLSSEVLLVAKLTSKMTLFTSAEHDFEYDDLSLPAGITEQLKSYTLTVSTSYSFSSTSRLSSGLQQKFYTDDNKRSKADLTWSFRPFGSALMPWVGFGGEFLSTARNRDGYYTPRSNTGIGPRLEYEYSFIPDRLTLSLFSGLNRTYDSTDKVYSWGHYTSLSFRAGNRNNLQAVLQYVRMDSDQGGDYWNQDELRFSLIQSF